MELLIDNRETKFIDLFKNKESNITFTIKQLDIGDFVIKKNGVVYLIIERKSVNDLYGSIRDGRYKEQKLRLVSNYNKTQILYIIEGEIKNQNNKYYKNYKSIIYGSIINTMYRDSIKIYKTINLEETLETVLYLYKKINDNEDFFIDKSVSVNSGSDLKIDKYIETIKLKKKDNLSPVNCNILQLSQIPGVSRNMSQSIIKIYSSISNLVIKYMEIEDCKTKEMFLKNIIYNTSLGIPIKTRKIGPVVSKRIYEYLFIDNN